MPRVNRIIAPGVPHHLTQRGNYRQTVFHSDADYIFYLDLLREYLPRYRVSLEAYCLMPNHVHLVATPENKTSISRALQRIHSDYARGLHLRLRKTGHLWQARFHSVALDDTHFWAAMLYVERNPVRAKLVDHPGDWRWSSARTHLERTPSDMLRLERWKARYCAARWARWLTEDPTAVLLEERIREVTALGFPAGDARFRDELRTLGLKTEPGKPGRPKRTCSSQANGLT